MLDLAALRLPLVAAPMAGGPSTPALVAAACDAGATGFLAAGYLPAARVAEQVAATQALTSAPFGVNLFLQDPALPEPAVLGQVLAYRESLLPLAAELGVDLPRPWPDDDDLSAKLDLLTGDPVAAVSFTFGLPDPDAVAALHAVGTCVLATVTSADDAQAALERGVDALVVQGPEAGGHRATLTCAETPGTMPLPDLVARVTRRLPGVPVVAAGGIGTRADVEAALAAGATAVQVGTALLLTDEAGTNQVHRAALSDPRFAHTEVTRAFSGRAARSLVNAFLAHHRDAPAAYPAVNQVTGPLRRAAVAQGRADLLHLWAGTAWRHARPGPAARVLESLAPR